MFGVGHVVFCAVVVIATVKEWMVGRWEISSERWLFRGSGGGVGVDPLRSTEFTKDCSPVKLLFLCALNGKRI